MFSLTKPACPPGVLRDCLYFIRYNIVLFLQLLSRASSVFYDVMVFGVTYILSDLLFYFYNYYYAPRLGILWYCDLPLR